MSAIDIQEFDEFFLALYGHKPFPWQSMLLRRVQEVRWPDLIDLPTASGKTACIDVSVFALAMGVPTPRRTWFVVDRRIVVDEAFERAERIAIALKYAVAGNSQKKAIENDLALEGALKSVNNKDAPVLEVVGRALLKLGGSQETPLQVGRLRGGVPRELGWAGNPAQPAVLTSTIDQVGSRLLFRGYGVGQPTQPVHAALAGNDSLIILDEAHLSAPFYQTARAVKDLRRRWCEESPLTPFELVVMSATPPDGMDNPLRFPAAEDRAEALSHDLLRQRMSACKPTVLAEAQKPKSKSVKGQTDVAASEDELVLDAANRAATFAVAGRQRIGVMVNRVATAENIYRQLVASGVAAEVRLLTGRLRPLDRDHLLNELTPKLRSGSSASLSKPMILVTTQCLEVGADFSFDALISECASLDALRQRFGRLARLGTPTDAEGVILIRKKEVRIEEKLDDDKPADPIYRNAAARTWNWMTEGKATLIEMGIDALAHRIEELERTNKMAPLLGPKLRAPTLLPAYLDVWSQTTRPRPAIEPEVALFLHGVPPPDEKPRVDVQVLWREDLCRVEREQWSDLITSLPPLPGELLQVPLRILEQVLVKRKGEQTSDADLEGLTETSRDDWRDREPSQELEPVIQWHGRDKCELRTALTEVAPNDTLIFPANSETFRALLPHATLPADVYEQAYRLKYGVPRWLIRNDEQTESSSEEIDEDVERQKLALEHPEDLDFLAHGKFAMYGRGLFHFTARFAPKPVDAWESDDDEDALLFADQALPLDKHTKDVRDSARTLAVLLELPEALIEAFLFAAEFHDVGKADARFQFILSGGRRAGATLLAKSKTSSRPSKAMTRRLYDESKLPKGFRHELLSLQMAERHYAASPIRALHALELHLIASHHGQCRPFPNVVVDEPSLSVACPSEHGEMSITPAQRTACPPHRLDSGVAERFWQLTRQYGWWGLAYLEAILRCADMHASAYAEKGGRP